MKLSTFFELAPMRSSVRTQQVRAPEMLLGYLIGPFGAMLSSGIFTSMLQNYFTDVLRLNLAFLTGLQLFSTILIVVANLVVGQMIERTRVMAGKARPWILLSAATLSIASVLMFVMPFEGAARMVWIALAYNLYYSVAYPIYNTANSTLIAVSTRDSAKRSVLASLANMAGLGVMGVGSMVFPMVASFWLKDDIALWFAVMLGVGVVTAFTVFLQYKFTRERVTEELRASALEEKAEAISLGRQLRAVTGEKLWWLIIAFYLLFQWSGAIKNGSMTYFCKWVLDNTFFGSADAWGASQGMLGVLGAIPMAAAAAVVVPLANRFGKRIVTCAGLLLGAAGGVMAGLGDGRIVPVAVGVALKCLGSAPACYLILAMLADVIDHIEYKSGIRTDGLTMSIYSSLMVAATPVMNAVFSAVLRGSGYNQDALVELGRQAQTAAARGAITVSYVWIETVAYVICAGLLWFFSVEKNLKAEQEEISRRHLARQRAGTHG